ncbi:MAG TPA: CTP-dependent riboflavin kinase [Candidatus Bathyarchaeota archaeon]|nr:CTP-dependent riboflavin kinase [Candidatus Bathyarchaeota archaeon]HEW89719.1 CTP-dependent riboflavin kinase [Candidatus Bathyarchaeota archaeon]
MFFTLLALAELGAASEEKSITTSGLAEKLGYSQQTASRHLIELEKAGLIARVVEKKGCRVRLTDSGLEALREVYEVLRKVLEPVTAPFLVLKGVVFTGLGEGAYYVTREGYKRQFVEKLGFEPYPGTLNLRLVEEESLKARRELDFYPGIEIKGFTAEGRTFGAGKCFRAIINDAVEGAVVMAYRTHYGPSVVELISPVCLRERLNLKDGDIVKVKVFP